MSARADDGARYLRQRMLAEVGTAGQERLASTRVHVASGTASARAHCVDYLRRAGLDVLTDSGHVEGQDAAAPLSVELPAGPAGSPHLAPAVDLLVGALGAVEGVKRALGVGRPLTLPVNLFLLGDE